MGMTTGGVDGRVSVMMVVADISGAFCFETDLVRRSSAGRSCLESGVGVFGMFWRVKRKLLGVIILTPVGSCRVDAQVPTASYQAEGTAIT